MRLKVPTPPPPDTLKRGVAGGGLPLDHFIQPVNAGHLPCFHLADGVLEKVGVCPCITLASLLRRM